MLREIYYLFLPYRSFLAPFLTLCAIAVPVWLVFRLYRRRTSRHRVSLTRELILLTFVVYLVGLATATLTPNRSDRLLAVGRGGVELRPNLAALTCSSSTLPQGSRSQGFCMHNLRGNVALFFPLGLLIPLVWRRLRFWKGMQVAIALSLSIELVQYLSSAWGSYRAVDVNDVILNVLGAALGLAIMSILRLLQGPRPAVARA
jgi:glycopeptide antibiotics resistance protein